VCCALAVIAVAVHKQGLYFVLATPYSTAWLLLLLVPLLLKKMLKVSSPRAPVLIAAVLATFIYLFSEQYLTKDTNKSDIKILMQLASTKAPLYQAMPGMAQYRFMQNAQSNIK